MSLEIHVVTAGPLETHAHIVADERRHALVVDVPPGAAGPIAALVRDHGLTVERILVTHPHWDHFADARELRDLLGVPVAAPAAGLARMVDPTTSLFPVEGADFAPAAITPDELVADGDAIPFGDRTVDVIATPGHEPAHVTYVLAAAGDRAMFSGDVIFPGGHGTLDVEGADSEAMQASLRRLAALGNDMAVYNGHGDPTAIGAERGWLPRE